VFFLINHFIKRLTREGFKSFAVPLLAFALAVLINLLGGIKAWLEFEFNDMMDNYPIIAELSDHTGNITDGLFVEAKTIALFTEPDVFGSLVEYTGTMMMKRSLDMFDISDLTEKIEHQDIMFIGVSANRGSVMRFREGHGITAHPIRTILTPSAVRNGASFDFFEGYSEIIELPENLIEDSRVNVVDTSSFFNSLFRMCLVSEDLLEFAVEDDEGNLFLRFFYQSEMIINRTGLSQNAAVETQLQIIGTLTGFGESVILAPYETVANLAMVSDGISQIITYPIGPLEDYFIDYLLRRRLQLLYFITDNEAEKANESGVMVGITGFDAADLSPENGAVITFYDGYGEDIFASDESVCLVGEDMLGRVEDGILRTGVRSRNPFLPAEYYTVAEAELTVIGTVSGDDAYGGLGGAVFVPFLTANALGAASDGGSFYAERLYITVADNLELTPFKETASFSFARVRPIYDSRPFSLTVYDTDFYDTLEPLRLNIILVESATPFVYFIAVCVGFIASILMTRRRKPEFAIMRSVGVHRLKIFFAAVTEQAALCAVGAVLGGGLVYLLWDFYSIERTLLFTVCYLLGTVFSAVKAAGTNVLKILHERTRD
jgi:hypothetical protein